jgi:starvation-inducible DNA-binding protein
LNVGVVIEYVLLTNTKNYHWNVVDPTFNDLHKFLERQYESFEIIVNELAERIIAIGVKSIGSLKEFIDETRLLKQPNITKAVSRSRINKKTA